MDTNLNGHIEVINTLYDDDEKAQNVSNIDSVKESLKYELNIVWRNVLLQILLHSFLFWEIYYLYQYPDQLSSAWTLLKFGKFYFFLFSSINGKNLQLPIIASGLYYQFQNCFMPI